MPGRVAWDLRSTPRPYKNINPNSAKYPRPRFESVELGMKNYKVKKFSSQAEYDKQIKRDVIAFNKTREKDFSYTGIRRPKMTAKKLKAE